MLYWAGGTDELIGILLGGGEQDLHALAPLIDHQAGLHALQAELGVAGQDGGSGVAALDGLELRVQAFLLEITQGLGPGRRGPVVAADILREDDLFQVAGVGVGVLAVGLGADAVGRWRRRGRSGRSRPAGPEIRPSRRSAAEQVASSWDTPFLKNKCLFISRKNGR